MDAEELSDGKGEGHRQDAAYDDSGGGLGEVRTTGPGAETARDD